MSIRTAFVATRSGVIRGESRFRGGYGIVRELEALCPSQVSILSDRRANALCGLEGGSPECRAEYACHRGRGTSVGGKARVWVKPGSIALVERLWRTRRRLDEVLGHRVH